MVRFLWYPEDTYAISEWRYIDKLLSCLGYAPTIVDRLGRFRPTSPAALTNPQVALHIFGSTVAARNHYAGAGYTFVTTHPDATLNVKDFQHPTTGDILYAVGSDMDGFDGRSLAQLEAISTVLSLKTKVTSYELFAQVALPMLAMDRWCRTPEDWV
ncbi:MAG: hypothetical protein OEO20_11530 [Gemmatimonadota bacterium]|nr:hypothetical protein [Gemmatimonadota bacterium]MDH3570618.1 hypothetical protein [Gemmatimonadota bacterium]